MRRTMVNRVWSQSTVAFLVASLLVPFPRANAAGVPFSAPVALSTEVPSEVVSETIEEMMADGFEVAQNRRSVPGKGAARNALSNADLSDLRGSQVRSKGDPVMAKARSLAASGQYQDASKLLFQMSRTQKYDKDSAQIKYILGLMLYEMKFYQSAAFVFYDVIRQESRSNPKSKYLRQSLEKIALAADTLNSDTLLRYAIKQIKEDEFPVASRDMLYYRLGEIKMSEKDYAAATREFVKVKQDSLFYFKARYKLALALAEAGKTDKAMLDKALLAFEDLIEQTKNLGVTDVNRVSALLGKARVIYQQQQFDGAIDAYRDVPRDTEQWHEALFESSWAMLRDGRFRSALSNFHSLHSTYYEDFYQPESLFLRAIVYLYICKYDEMDRVVGMFEKVYKPVQRDVKAILTSVTDPATYYSEMARIAEKFDTLKATDRAGRRGFKIPFIVARQVLKEGDVRRTFNYLGNLETERQRLGSMPPAWRAAGVGLYVKRILEQRVKASRVYAGKQVRHHLALIQDELADLFEQTGFLRFEMLSSKKETLRKEIAGKELEKAHVDDNESRNFYVQNGYEYWPFTGEYWLDEIGNYHYVGVKACAE
jgi:TolA-binding protein